MDLPILPLFVVIITTPLPALAPYIAAAPASFNISIDSMSFGFAWVIRDKVFRMNGVDYRGDGYYWGGWGGVAVDVGTCGLTAIPKAGGTAVIKVAAKEGGEAVAREIAERAAREVSHRPSVRRAR